MRKYYAFVLCFGMLIANPFDANVFAQLNVPDGVWASYGPGDQNVWINSIWADPQKPNFLFAESNGALFRSIDAGVFWNRIETPMNAVTRPLLAANGLLYVAVDNNGVFSSAVNGAISWKQAPAPMADKTVNQIFQHNGRLFAGTTAAGLYFSDDAGENWTQAGALLHDKPILKIAASGETLFAATGDFQIDGLFRSKDAGLTWTELSFPVQGQLFTIARDMLFITDGFGNSDTQGIWRSVDDGETWEQTLSLGSTTKLFRGLVAAGDNLFAWALRDEFDFFNGLDLFLVSRDGGASWSPGELAFVTDVISLNGITIATTVRDGVFLSYDSGDTWAPVNAPPLDQAIGYGVVALLTVGNTLYASALYKLPCSTCGGGQLKPGGVFISTDNARNWTRTTQGLTENTDVTDIEVDLNYVLALNSSQLFRSADKGLNWSDITTDVGLTNESGPIGLFKVGGTVFISFIFGKIIIYSLDGGRNWNRSNGDNIAWTMISAKGSLYAGSISGRVLRSTDGGVNWTQSALPTDGEVISLLFSDDMLYAGATDGLFISGDNGINWEKVNTPFDRVSVGKLVATTSTIVASTGAGVYFSADKGVTWAQASPPLNDKSVSMFVFTNGRLFANAGGVYFSDDGGNTWTQADAPMNNKSAAVMISIADRVYAGTADGVYWTFTADGRKWFELKTGIGDRKVNTLDYLPVSNRLYAATDHGVYLQTLDTAAPNAKSVFINGGAEFAKSDTVEIFFSVDNADSMIISENPAFSDTVWQAYRSQKSFKLSTTADGAKTVYAKFKDLSSNESVTLSAQIILDRNNPDFSKFPHAPPSAATPDRAIRITQQVEEDNLASFDLFFRRVGETWDHNARKIGFVNNTAVIDSERVNNRGLDYQIIATDMAGRGSTLQNGMLDFFSLPVNIAATALGNSRSLPSGSGSAAYRIVSIPLDLQNSPPVKNVFQNLGKYGQRGKWRFYSYSGNGQWQEGENISMQTGSAYFIIQRDGGSLTNAISSTTARTTEGVLGNISGWKLRAGDWTLVGNPYITRIELNQLKLKRQGTLLSNHGTDVQIWSYDGQWKNPTTDPELALETWGGLLVRTSEADTIVFANDKEPYSRSAGKASIAVDHLAEGEWTVQITATNGEFSDEVNYFGVKKEAKDEFDNLDWYEPPSLPDGIGLSFPHTEWNDPVELTADFRTVKGDGHRWEIAVKAEPAHAVQLSFANIATVQEDLRVLLVDETTKIVRDLRKEPTFAIRLPESGVKTLAIIAGNDFFINKNTAGMLSVPTTFALHQNYPNPFNPSTTIRYQLPVAGRVTLKIFDIIGRQVMALEENKSREPGYYEMVADMSNLGSGVYFYRIAVTGEQNFQATKKMLFLK